MQQIDELDDDAWIAKQRTVVWQYIKDQQLPCLSLPEWPEWDCAPYLALWALEDPQDPGFVGHWLLAGDVSGSQLQSVPFDHLAATDCAEPQQCLAAIAAKWRRLAAAGKQGQDWSGAPQFLSHPLLDLAARSQQLARQAELLAQFAADEDLWLED